MSIFTSFRSYIRRVPAHNQGDSKRGIKGNRGFTLIELLVVAAILGVIIAIAIPNLLGARKSANRVSGQASVKAIRDAEQQHYDDHGKYGKTAAALESYIKDDNLREAMKDPCKPKNGYCFKLDTNIASPYDYGWLGAPVNINVSDKAVAVYSDNVIRCKEATSNNDFAADKDSPSCGGPTDTTSLGS